MRVAIVGTGISGLVAAHLLHRDHDLTVFEANPYIGGHTHTVEVEQQGRNYAVDTGFIVFNPHTYPNFIRLLEQLDVAWRDTEMSFSVQHAASGLEYCGSSLNTLFAQRANLLRLSFYGLLWEILRFNRTGQAFLREQESGPTLADFLARHAFSRAFREQYLLPMAAAIWSAQPEVIGAFPAATFLRFFANHGLLSATGHHTWRTVAGGSARYVEKLTAPFRERIRTGTPVRRVTRGGGGVIVQPLRGEAERYDRVILATHSDQALRLLADPGERERDILGAIPYQRNEVALHTDATLLPRSRRAWASWNYHIPAEPAGAATVTYNMNLLQGLRAPEPFCVTLNATGRIAPGKLLRRFTYHHPVFDGPAVAARERHGEINGVNGTFYCGAYWGNGFHEDGVRSALAVGAAFGKQL